MLRATFFPTESPGNVRIHSFAKYLAEFGFDITLAMLSCDRKQVICENIEKSKKDGYVFSPVRIPRWLNFFIKTIDYFLWRYCCYSHNWCFKCLILQYVIYRRFSKEDFDAVFVSVPQPGSLSVARSIAKRFEIPMIVDFRDLPDELDVEHRKGLTRREFRYTVNNVKDAKFAITVSPQLREALVSRYGLNDVSVIYNGYDGAYEVNNSLVLKSNSFDILYTGILGVGRDPSLIFQGLDALICEGFDLSNVRMVFVGAEPRDLDVYKRYNCFPKIIALGRKTRSECFAMQKVAGALVSLSSQGCPGILTSKVFDYAKAGRPIISVPCDYDVLDDFIKSAGIGVSCNTVEEVSQWLREQICAWRNGLPTPNYNPNIEYLSSFSRKSQSIKLANALKSKFSNGK